MERRIAHFIIFYTVFAAVLCVIFLKAVLLVTRYGITVSAVRCVRDSNNQTTAVETDVRHEYIFTTTMYAIINILRIVEYALLARSFYVFLFKQDNIIEPGAFFKKHSRRFCYLFLYSIILLPYFLLGLTIPGVGIYQEIEHTDHLALCYRHYFEIYVAYCAVNVFRYLSAYTVRVLMMHTALSLSKIWFPDDSPPQHTSQGLVKLDSGKDRKSSKLCDYSGECHCSVDVATSQSSDHNNTFDEFQKVLDDWKAVSADYQVHVLGYAEVGKQVQVIQELFQTWFVIPWVIYSINTSLKVYNVLQPWNADGDGNLPYSKIPQIYYLLFNINQLITLIIPYLCAKKINTYHQKYYKLMRNYQLDKYKDDPSRLSFARQLIIERKSEYDFEPRIVGTNIKITIGSLLYVVILLAGLFMSVMESIF